MILPYFLFITQNYNVFHIYIHKKFNFRCNRNGCSYIFNVNIYDSKKVYKCEICFINHDCLKLRKNLIKRCFLWYSYSVTMINQNYLPEAIQILLPALKSYHHVAITPNFLTHLAEISMQYCFMNII